MKRKNENNEKKEIKEKKHFSFSGINIVLVGNEQSKIRSTANTEGLQLNGIVFCLESGRTFSLNGKRFNVIAKCKPENLASIIEEADVILFIDATEDEISHCEKLRKANPDCIAIDFIKTGLSFNQCLDKMESLIKHAKYTISQAKALDQPKSDLFLLGNRLDKDSRINDLPPELADIIIVQNHELNCNFNASLSFFKTIPEEQTVDMSSSLMSNI
ncbi:MAG: hypothetical protein H0U73_11070 [Tatlockia sp.]|nr:hypothetical protein [Tatlockia sp.]